jgi:hypothetical protein
MKSTGNSTIEPRKAEVHMAVGSMSTQGEGSQFVCYVEQPQTVRKSAWRRSMVAVGKC